jgi:2-hydroxy-3-keto-5-methylthiopentenyl-1-phosphate phosphatase
MPHAFLCDFDGTVSPHDIGAAFLRHFSANHEAERSRLLERWRSGELGSREVTERECEWVRVEPAEALEFARGFALDPDFAPFARERTERGEPVVVVSDGFDFYIRELLERERLGDLAYAANRARFERGGVVPDFPYAGESCGRCGNCKGAHVRHWRKRGYRTVAVGDGLSDRCAAREADAVFARGELLEWCRREGLAARPAENFAEVAGLARRLSSGEWS